MHDHSAARAHVTQITTTHWRDPNRGEARVLAIFAFRYDAQLVPALIENLRPMVHGCIAYDDRGSDVALSEESVTRTRLNAAALAAGADWILAVDPDERYEPALAQCLPGLTAPVFSMTLWSFRLREMFTGTTYRTDGLWGNRTRMRLYPAAAAKPPLGLGIHRGWVRSDPAYRRLDCGLNLYHLRHCSPIRTQRRCELYAAADPLRVDQEIGYDYLTDMRGAVLEEMPPHRRFQPPHVEDHGLWAPDPGEVGTVLPDPIDTRLRWIERTREKNGLANAAATASDLVEDRPEDPELRLLAASLCLQAGDSEGALAILPPDETDRDALAKVLAARAHLELGKPRKASRVLDRLRHKLPDNLMLRALAEQAAPEAPDFAAPDALWRRILPGGEATLDEGAENGRGPLTVVVITHARAGSPARTIAELRAQSPATEIVVVHSGGGDRRSELASDWHHIRLICVEDLLRVGAARNIGLLASRGRILTFLAGDCRPGPGWIEAKITRHQAGSRIVSSAVVSSQPGSPMASIASEFVFHRRAPDTDVADVYHDGCSYDRSVFCDAGLFAPTLRIGEDTEFNERAHKVGQPVWAPEIQVIHDDPPDLPSAMDDLRRRGVRAAVHKRPPTARDDGWIDLFMATRALMRDIACRIRTGQPQSPEEAAVLDAAAQAFAAGLRRGDRRLRLALRLRDMAAKAVKAPSNGPLRRRLALVQARAAVRLSPQDWRVQMTLAEAELQLGTEAGIARAIAALQMAGGLAPSEVLPVEKLVATLLARQETAAADAAMEWSRFMAPSSYSIAYQAAVRALKGGRREAALFHAQSALLLMPSRPAAHRLVAEMYRKLGRKTAARRRDAMADELAALMAGRQQAEQARAAEASSDKG
ncbi:MAG: glycosyltransferase [Rubellimicrobium sp.]|nr:glycosyltransferase [Rubellimicrobium sp.]